jgi:Restriction endonuclease AspBHI N-terminal/Restriction endonuclease
MKVIPFDELNQADLIVDAIYEGGANGNAGDDPLAKLLSAGNQGGFRCAGAVDTPRYIVLYTSGDNNDWPDTIDVDTGIVNYYGDNKKPGHELHDTPKKGNLILRNMFSALHEGRFPLLTVPPVLLFKKLPTAKSSRSVQFKGLCVPGAEKLSATEDLVAVWRSASAQRFQNYKAIFTILDVPKVSRNWLVNLENGREDVLTIPEAFKLWQKMGIYKALIAKRTLNIRSIDDQVFLSGKKLDILMAIFNYFKGDPYQFEYFAADLYSLSESNVVIDEVTRGVVDGGRDAIGRLKIGLNSDPVYVEFALEAKCYNPGVGGSKVNTVGVKETSRLISRIRNRQFGVMVTTSAVAKQAYTEIKEDGHPIVIISGADIVNILLDKGVSTVEDVNKWLQDRYLIGGCR